MKILVPGPRAFVGARIMAALGDAVGAPSLRNAGEEDIRRLVDGVRPDLVIHTAAISDIRTCENNAGASWHANVLIPVWLARTGVKTVAFSTDQVYGGCAGDGPFAEDDAAPVNLYARHKLEMERRTLEAYTELKDMPSCDYVIVNDDLETAVRQLEAIVVAEQCSALHNAEVINTFLGGMES